MRRGLRGESRLAIAVAVSLLGLLGLGCAGAGGPTDPRSSATTPIARTWRSRCGGCHTRVEPGARSRPELEVALGRHRKRVKLEEGEWRDMVAFLAREEPAMLFPPSPPVRHSSSSSAPPAVDEARPPEPASPVAPLPPSVPPPALSPTF